MANALPAITFVQARGTASYVRRAVPMPAEITTSQVYTHTARSLSYQKRPVVLNTSTRQMKQRPAVEISARGAINASLRRQSALLLFSHDDTAAHIATAINSAITSGQDKRGIFVVDTASTDDTRSVAISLLGEHNVLHVAHDDKAAAFQRALKRFSIERDYLWLHIADAASEFGPDYFHTYDQALSTGKYVAAVRTEQSPRRNWIDSYQTFSNIMRQHKAQRRHEVPSLASPLYISCLRTDILGSLDLNALDQNPVTLLQIRRQHLGKVLFLSQATSFAQEPTSFGDFCKQTYERQHNLVQTIKEHLTNRQGQHFNTALIYQFARTVALLALLGIALPLAISRMHSWLVIGAVFAIDLVFSGIVAVRTCLAARNRAPLRALPYFYLLRWLETGIYLWAFLEVMTFDFLSNEAEDQSTGDSIYLLGSA